MSKFNYKWKLSDGYPALGVEQHNKKVFTTFACGGGSTMGYKLAGYDVVGANDIDLKMKEVYIANHKPRHYIFGSISDLKTKDLPKELFELDILDGSPPCSTFSMAGSRERSWKRDKQFREGQTKQVLSDLFFEFIAVAERLQPKVIIAENVKGMLLGNAKLYTKEVVKRLGDIGYIAQVFLLNAASMGVPQRRERVFFICRKRGLNFPNLILKFNLSPVLFKEISENRMVEKYRNSETIQPLWEKCKPGKSLSSVHPKGHWFGSTKADFNKVVPTIIANQGGSHIFHPIFPRHLTDMEYIMGGSFPLDYNFLDIVPKYLIGMSVPPVMMAQVADQVYKQWLSKT